MAAADEVGMMQFSMNNSMLIILIVGVLLNDILYVVGCLGHIEMEVLTRNWYILVP